jgi:hypothetical protein
MVKVFEKLCLLRTARECGAQISEVESSVIAHVKRPSSARPDASAALPGVTTVTSPGIPHDFLPSRALSGSRRTAQHPFCYKAFRASMALGSSIFIPPMSRYTSFHSPRDLSPLPPCTSPGIVKYCYYRLGTLQSTLLQSLYTRWGP